MCLRKAARVIPFFVTLSVGITAGFIARSFGEVVPVEPPTAASYGYATGSRPACSRGVVGTWRGTWGDDGYDTTLEIARTEGRKFYGTLTKAGYRVAFEGTFDPDSRQVFLRETRVLGVGPDHGGWSLGNNVGFLSADAQTLSGTGQDEFGTYTWHAAKQ